jgi:hypothetical protein
MTWNLYPVPGKIVVKVCNIGSASATPTAMTFNVAAINTR